MTCVGLAAWPGRVILGSMAKLPDIDRPGGWLIEEVTPGNPPIKRYFKVYELDEQKAIELARAYGATGRP